MIIEQPPEYIIAIGLDCNERNTFKWSNLPSKVIHIDSIVSENSRDHSFIDEGYITNLQYLLSELANDSELKIALTKSRVTRVNLMENLCQDQVVTITHEDDKLYTDMVIQGINNIYNTDCNFVIDSGLHRLYCAALLKLDISCSYYSSINNAHMGWAIPASMGTKLADPKRHCICITGDGCMLMNGIEIQTAAKYNIKVLFIVLNNGAHGAIKNADRKFNKIPELDDNHYSIPNHDWQLFAKAFGMLAITISHISQLEPALELFKKYPSPILLNVECHYDNNVDINIYYDKIVSLALN
jgi:thiamine pyrophosphate-dependent acetolactate synthase large subunit-like protein